MIIDIIYVQQTSSIFKYLGEFRLKNLEPEAVSKYTYPVRMFKYSNRVFTINFVNSDY